MKLIGKSITITLMLLISFVIQLNASPVIAEEMFEEVSTEDYIYIRGLISKVYPDKMQISVRPPKGKLVRILIDPDTILDGVSQIDQFEKEQQVKIWYSIDNNDNRAIMIKKMMDLGC